MRSKYGTFPEYHTSLDNLDFISKEGLLGGYSILSQTINLIEKNLVYKPVIYCEPQLGKRNLYNVGINDAPDLLVNLLAYIDGKLDLLSIAQILNKDFFECVEVCEVLIKHKLIKN